MTDLRRFSIIPIRAISMVKHGTTWRTLASLCCHTSPNGIAYPGQTTIGELCGMRQSHVSEALKELHELGLVKVLVPKGKRHPNAFQRGNRYFVPYEPGAPLPSEHEIEIPWNSRTNRWPPDRKRGAPGGE